MTKGTDHSRMPTRPLRILVGLESSGPGGAENMVASLAAGLRARGHDASIITDQPGWMTDRAQAAGVPVWIETQAPGIDLKWIGRLARRMRTERIDVFHSHEFSMNVFGGAAALLARVPHLATIHGRHYVTESPRRVMAYRLLRRLGVPIVAVSADLRAFLAKGFGLDPSRLEIVANGIEVPADPTRLSGAIRDAARSRLGLPTQVPLLLCVGNLYPVKDHATLVRALSGLPGVHLAIAGRGDEEANLRRLAQELGLADRLHLLGLRDDVPALIDVADVFVQPSQSEGLPLAVLEAMGHGIPVVASRVGGIPEAIKEGESGLLVPPGDSAGFAGAIGKILRSSSLADALGKGGRARALAEFSFGTMVDRYLNRFGSILDAS